MCFLFFHKRSRWSIFAEVPLWKNGDYSISSVVAGDQPKRDVIYRTSQGLTRGIEPDPGFRIIGKLIEQRRRCERCGLTETKYTKILV